MLIYVSCLDSCSDTVQGRNSEPAPVAEHAPVAPRSAEPDPVVQHPPPKAAAALVAKQAPKRDESEHCANPDCHEEGGCHFLSSCNHTTTTVFERRIEFYSVGGYDRDREYEEEVVDHIYTLLDSRGSSVIQQAPESLRQDFASRETVQVSFGILSS